MVVKIKKSLLVLFVIISFVTFFVFFLHKEVVPTYQIISTTQSDEKPDHKALVTLLISDIQTASKNFYKDYFTINPTVSENDVVVLDVEQASEGNYKIVIRTLPYLGAHLMVGCDEITFIISNDDSVMFDSFSHIESDQLPPNMQNLVIKPLPKGNDS